MMFLFRTKFTKLKQNKTTDEIIMTAKHYILSKKAFQILYEAVKQITFCEIPEVKLRCQIPESYTILSAKISKKLDVR